MKTRYPLAAFSVLALLAACQQETNVSAGTPAAPPAETVQPAGATRSPGKPSAPVDIEYQVLGTPLLGQPVAVEIRLISEQPGQLMRVNYFINDADSLAFADTQPRSIDVEIPRDEPYAARQVRVVPQREGRVYLNVTAEVTTANGMMLKSIAVPISVGSNAVSLELNGELRQTDGETVISLPAREN